MHGPGDTLYDKLFYDLLAGAPQPLVQSGDAEHRVLLFPNGQRTALFRYSDDPDLFSRIAAVMKSVPEVVLVGGPPGAASRLKSVKPFFSRVAVSTIHLPDSCPPVYTNKPTLGTSTPATRVVARGIVGAPNAEGWSALMTTAAAQHQVLQVESTRFAEVLTSRRPVGTYTLLAVIAVMFAIELALGGPERNTVLVRLGALIPRLVAQEPWRLFTSAFLHIGWMHVLLNSYVLVVIGGFLERVIGTWRFLVIFWLSVLGGSLVSLAVSPAELTAGASGGVIGLLAAQGQLAFRPHGLLPKTLIPGAKRAALINLAINAFNSLRPGVSLTAHLGGAIVGAGLVFTPWLVAGLPKLGDEHASTARIDPPWIRPTALLGIVAMAVSLAFGLAGGLSLLGPQKLVAKPIGAHTITLPAGITSTPPVTTDRPYGKTTKQELGDLQRDPVAYIVVFTDLATPLLPDALAAEWASVKTGIQNTEATFTADGALRESKAGGRDIAVTRFTRNDHALDKETAAYVTATGLVLVSSYYFNGEPSGPGSAERALASFDAK